MKKYSTCFLFILFFSNSFSQEWTWMKGTDTLTQPGIYGTKGISSPSNNPGSRHGAATWVDNNGDLWLFGGEGQSTTTALCWLNDLWKYTKATNEWTWMHGSNLQNQNGIYGTKGVASSTNEPGAREFMMYWTDASGNFWLFGGEGFGSVGGIGELNDLWRYNPTTNEWTWMKGSNVTGVNGIYGIKGTSSPTNEPGGRNGAGAIADNNGNFWLFGGHGLPAVGVAGNLNDFWRYSIATNEWTWMHGSNQTDQVGIYGTKGIANPTNAPGSREFPTFWKDLNGDLVLFGGSGFPAALPQGYLQDMWKYNVATNSWMWLNGTTSTNQQGNYGTQNIPNPTNLPGGRFSCAGWTDLSGNLWLFGGFGYANTASPGKLNDLFKFNPTSGEWSWEHGMNSTNNIGVYGVQGLSAPPNTPGSREFNTFWTQRNNEFWLFGGQGNNGQSFAQNNLDDLWKFNPACSPNNATPSSSLSLCSGNSSTLMATASSGTLSWYNSSTSTVSIGTGSTFVTPILTASGSSTVYNYYVETSTCPLRTSIALTVHPTPTVSIFTDNPLVCAGTTMTISASGASTYTWNTGANGNTISISPSVTTIYTVSATDVNGCKGTASLTQSVSACTGIDTFETTKGIVLSPNPSSGTFQIHCNKNNLKINLINNLGQLILSQTLELGMNSISEKLATGLYHYSILDKDVMVTNGKLIIEN